MQRKPFYSLLAFFGTKQIRLIGVSILATVTCAACQQSYIPEKREAGGNETLSNLLAGKRVTSVLVNEYFYNDGDWSAFQRSIGQIRTTGMWEVAEGVNGQDVLCVVIEETQHPGLKVGDRICRHLLVNHADNRIRLSYVTMPDEYFSGTIESINDVAERE